jgi:hypothetical protein
MCECCDQVREMQLKRQLLRGLIPWTQPKGLCISCDRYRTPRKQRTEAQLAVPTMQPPGVCVSCDRRRRTVKLMPIPRSRWAQVKVRRRSKAKANGKR